MQQVSKVNPTPAHLLRGRGLRQPLALAQHRGAVVRPEARRVLQPGLQQAAQPAAAAERAHARGGVGRLGRGAQREVVSAAAQRVVDLGGRINACAFPSQLHKAGRLSHRNVSCTS